jgi:hypothetical protein
MPGDLDVPSGKPAPKTQIRRKIFEAMDLYKAIQDLYAEKEKLERVIASLEELQLSTGVVPEMPRAGGRRGRKSMSESERQEVSERMKRYWESRRKRANHDANASSTAVAS